MMWGFDPNSGLAGRSFFPEGISLTEWLSRWLEGRLRQPMLVKDPQTRVWRGATDAEHEAQAREVAELVGRINGALADAKPERKGAADSAVAHGDPR
ncbi:hypothetical protein SAMN05444365_11631 [Micromonospora pattaloongensis]|uniref:Uncharacterized protein n=2 Tax=Micromonospora pattaloongensis TaxID=405436 RepID=A0A1H3T078_9ACTN|nr:hypothetical protein SAMN05444365_11631 [Micromonospora pattaloongensis]